MIMDLSFCASVWSQLDPINDKALCYYSDRVEATSPCKGCVKCIRHCSHIGLFTEICVQVKVRTGPFAMQIHI